VRAHSGAVSSAVVHVVGKSVTSSECHPVVFPVVYCMDYEERSQGGQRKRFSDHMKATHWTNRPIRPLTEISCSRQVHMARHWSAYLHCSLFMTWVQSGCRYRRPSYLQSAVSQPRNCRMSIQLQVVRAVTSATECALCMRVSASDIGVPSHLWDFDVTKWL